MRLAPLDRSHVPLVASWLADEKNHRWLDFGRGRQVIPSSGLMVMSQQPFHRLFTFPAADSNPDKPVGVVGLSDISTRFRYATLWYVLGDKAHARQGYTSRAVRAALEIAFKEMDLHSVEAWALETNQGSIAVLRNNGFKEMGRRRECHELGGMLEDRIHFDILAHEFLGHEARHG